MSDEAFGDMAGEIRQQIDAGTVGVSPDNTAPSESPMVRDGHSGQHIEQHPEDTVEQRIESKQKLHRDAGPDDGMNGEPMLQDSAQDAAESYREISESLAKNQGLSPEQQQFFQQGTQQLMQQKMSLDNDYNSIDWNRLDQENPGLGALTRQRFQQAYGQLQGQYGQISGVITQHQANAQKAAQRQQAEAQATLKRLIPAWQDSEVANREKSLLTGFASKNYGFERADIEGLEDPRAIKVLRDLMLSQQRAKRKPKRRAKARQQQPQQPKEIPVGGQDADIIARIRSAQNR